MLRNLIPCIDKARDIHACLGTRSYVVSLVKTRWSGGQRGRGVEEVIEEVPILPTPAVSGIGELDLQNAAPGREEFGAVSVSEISARFTEDQLLGRAPDGSRVPADQNFYWEIRAVSTGVPVRRRFQVANPPELDMGSLQWKVTLVRAAEDRTRQLGMPKS